MGLDTLWDLHRPTRLGDGNGDGNGDGDGDGNGDGNAALALYLRRGDRLF